MQTRPQAGARLFARSRTSASIFVALGLALAFKASGLGGAAALAMTAALFHALNHAAVQEPAVLRRRRGADGDRRARGMERLGGLLNRMPATGFFMLVGCAAISALPPLNGFVSEWLMLQAILLEPAIPAMDAETAHAGGRRDRRAGGGAGRRLFRARLRHPLPRPPAQRGGRAAAREVDRFSLAAMARARRCSASSPASFPARRSTRSNAVALALTGRRAMPVQSTIPWLSIAPIAASRSSYNGLLVFLFIAASAALGAPRHSSLRLGRAAARAGLGLRLSRPEPGDAIHRRELQPADPPGVRRLRLPRARADRHAGARARRGRRSRPQARAIRIWDALYTPLDRRRRARPRCSSTACSSSPSGST